MFAYPTSYAYVIGESNELSSVDGTDIATSVILGTGNKFPTNVTGAYVIGGSNSFVKHTEAPKTNAFFVSIGNMNQHHTGFTYAMGHRLITRAQGETAVGLLNTDYEPVSYVRPNPNSMDRVFSIGNGYYRIDNSIVRRDALTVHQNGLVIAPTVNNGLIDQYPKALVTKEWVDNKVTASEFVRIIQGANSGYGTKYRAENPDLYTPIGNNALDLSYATSFNLDL